MPTKSFEDRLGRLEKLAEKLREGKIPLEEAVAVFEEGMKLARSLEKDLSRVERKVERLADSERCERFQAPWNRGRRPWQRRYWRRFCRGICAARL